MSSYKIGLDFGTTNSIVSYLTPSGDLEAFPYPPPNGEKYVPSFIAYHSDGDTEIGTPARTAAAHDSSVETYGNFKMRLPLKESEFGQYFSGDRTPISVTIDYLRELLISNENDYSFSREKGEIASIVVSVPEIWQRDIRNLGRERLQELIKKDLGLEKQLIQLVSEPVAAAAYYTWETQRRAKAKGTEPFSGNILVCDMGGGTFDVSLCRIYGDKKVEVLYFHGQGDKGLESAGVAFDRRVVQQAYTKKHGKSLDENTADFTSLLKDFESVKIGSHVNATKKLTNYLDDPDDTAQKEAYKFSGYAVTLGEVNEAFAPISQGIKKVINKIIAHTQEQGLAIDRIFLVGGFCQFLLVQKAITDALGIVRNDPRIDQTFNITNSAYAISYGACLIANGLVDPTEKYIHTLGIGLRSIIADQKVQKEITLIEGGSNLDALAKPNFCTESYQTAESQMFVSLWVQINSKGKRHQELMPQNIEVPNHQSGAKYRAGMKVDRSQIAYLAIEEVSTKKCVEYELGNILAKMFPGYVFFDEDEFDDTII
ncbi:MAG: Hsp70 family protein [Tychonema bourrellyi B0820]|uniref:Hsp70 family protein n=1 Tax=Tychonema bourrellyi FEM_GT703 TaxID=2040638 RepID=A0A2G4F1U6_9CYAN|nr:Hsp70 family protein [Tychonema bourrellyi]MDQ2098827.1 Hsp70 family protein [Tychonema bourrellyi B0820]PHX55740.1 Hsp70 family protein [Tychonema bourrellyi FEM_GT703]